MMNLPRRVDRGLIASLAAGELLALGSWAGQATDNGPGTMALLGVAAGLWLYLIVRTVRRMAQWEQDLPPMTYRLGVLGFGLPMWILSTITHAVRHAGGGNHVFSAAFVSYVLFYAAFGFPFNVWAGYLFGRMMFGTR